MSARRNYAQLLERVNQTLGPDYRLHTLAEIAGDSIVLVRRSLRDDVPEVRVIKDWVRDRRFEFVCDLHEDWESPGFYLYEMRRGAPLMGTYVVDAVEQVCPLNLCDQIEDLQAVRGVILNDEERANELRGEVIPIELYHGYTDHPLTVESPTERRMAVRVAAHMAALDVVVAAHLPPRT